MKILIVQIVVASTILRSLTSCVLFWPGGNNASSKRGHQDILAQWLGPGILPAIRASILDPVHSWNHIEEACFWMNHPPSSSVGPGAPNAGSGGYYGAIYTPGTRVVQPPLVLAMFGEAFVCRGDSSSFRSWVWIVQQLLLLIADAVAAWSLYRFGSRALQIEQQTGEFQIERNTLNDDNDDNGEGVPMKLRAPMGWVFGLPYRVQPDTLEQENSIIETETSTQKEQNISADENNNQEDSSLQSTLQPNDLLLKEPILSLQQLPLLTATLYFINPISFIANANGSLRGMWDALLLISLQYAVAPPIIFTSEGVPIKNPSASISSFFLALATYVDVGYFTFIFPVLLWRGMIPDPSSSSQTLLQHRRFCHDWKIYICLYGFYLVGLHGLSSMLVGGDFDEYKHVMIRTILPNIAFVEQDGSGSLPGPNMSLHWYFFVQMFDRFRPYFTVLINGVPAVLIAPLLTRLYRYPSALVASFQFLWSVFRPIATIHTFTLALILATLNPRTLVRMLNRSIISLFSIPVPILLFVTFHRMWLVTGNGNANYIFFQCLAYDAFATIICLDFVAATIKRDKVRRMIEKGDIKKKVKDTKCEQREDAKEALPVHDADHNFEVEESETNDKPGATVVFL